MKCIISKKIFFFFTKLFQGKKTLFTQKQNNPIKPIVHMHIKVIFIISSNYFTQYLADSLGLPWIELGLLAVQPTISNSLGIFFYTRVSF